MSPYRVTLVNLSADARTVVPAAYPESHDMTPATLQDLLRNFSELDPIENAVADTEIRVQTPNGRYLLRTEQKKLILYDAHRRDLPGQILTLPQVIAELDGTASAARSQTILQARAVAEPVPAGPVLPVAAPAAVASKPRVVALSAIVVALLAAIIYLAGPLRTQDIPAGFVPVPPGESGALRAGLAGVYLTGSEPGEHGIVVTGPVELKLFELGTVEAPRVLYAGYRLGRIGPKLCLATDQPGGVVEVREDGALVYCGETYQRLP